MLRYLLHRLGLGVLVLWAAFTLSFVLLQVLPGDAVLIKFENPDLGLSAAQIHAMRVAYAADSPMWQQYLHSLIAVMHGQLGYSVEAGVPVTALLASSLPGTLKLALLGYLMAACMALVVAIVANLPFLHWCRSLLQGIPALFASVPAFWIGVMLIQLVSFQLGWIPVINPSPSQRLILPILAVAIPVSAPLAQILLRSIDDVRTQPFIGVIRAKGAGASYTLLYHVLHNALLPVISIAGLLLGELIAGAIVTESVFGLGGIGQLTQQAVNNQDVAVLQAIVLLSALGFVVINLLVDLGMPWLDPRLRQRLGGTQ